MLLDFVFSFHLIFLIHGLFVKLLNGFELVFNFLRSENGLFGKFFRCLLGDLAFKPLGCISDLFKQVLLLLFSNPRLRSSRVINGIGPSFQVVMNSWYNFFTLLIRHFKILNLIVVSLHGVSAILVNLVPSIGALIIKPVFFLSGFVKEFFFFVIINVRSVFVFIKESSKLVDQSFEIVFG